MNAEDDIDGIVMVVMVLIYALPLVLLVGGLFIGAYLEKRHFASIREREARFATCPVVPSADWDRSHEVAEAELVTASVVVSLDYCKRFLAKLRNIFGGRIRSYESLLDRAKREAILRLHEQAPHSDLIVNLRLESSNIVSVTQRKGGVGGVEVLACGTAIRYRKA